MDVEEKRIRDGDIYHWRWKDDERHENTNAFGGYHCKSRIAVATDGDLFDTYWMECNGRSRLRMREVIVTLLGNSNDMDEIREWDLPYYRDEDIVDTRHPNASIAPIYLKRGAKRDATTMRAHAVEKMDQAKRDLDSAHRQIGRMAEVLNLIDSGDLEKVCF